MKDFCKRIIFAGYVLFFNARIFIRRQMYVYKKWTESPEVQEFVLFWCFVLRKYSAKSFSPLHVKNNVKLLSRYPDNAWFDATQEGELIPLESFQEKCAFVIKNFLFWGIFGVRVRASIYYTFITLTIELCNPFTKRVLKEYLERKIALVKRLLEKRKKINGWRWDHAAVEENMRYYRIGSIVQCCIIDKMHLAIKLQGEPPIIKRVKEVLAKGITPILVIEGSSGAYWMRTSINEVAGLFKPFDEEIHAPNNPIGPIRQGALGQRRTRPGTRVGESAHHEVATYVVDAFLGFGIVPRTYYATFRHHIFFQAGENRFDSLGGMKTKYGSFQEYIDGFVPLHKLSPEEYGEIPLLEFQLLVVLDLIIGNTDRNTGNLLIGDEKIAAIDHGLAFTDYPEDLSAWYWYRLPHGREPLHPSLCRLIDRFPLDRLGWKLQKKCMISKASIDRMRERLALFRAGLHAHLCPCHMTDLMVSKYLSEMCGFVDTVDNKAQEVLAAYIPELTKKRPSLMERLFPEKFIKIR